MDKKKILLVEDEAVTAMDIRSGLVQLGYEVVAIVSTGKDAICKSASLLPDLILMDITLAGPMNGIEAATEIGKKHGIPIIFLTSHTDTEAIESAKKTHPFGYLSKPINIQSLAISIDVAIYKSNADVKVRASEERYRDLVELAMSVVLRWDIHGTVTYINEYGASLFGYRKDEIVGRNVMGTIVGETDSAGRNLRVMIEEITAAPEKYLNNENENRTRDGKLLWMHWRNAAVLADDGTLQEVLSIGNDVTDRKRAEVAMQENRLNMLAILNNLPFLAWLKDRDGRFLVVNDPFARSCGMADPDALIGKTDLDIWPARLAEAYRAADREVMTSRQQQSVEEFVADQGQEKWFETFKSPLFDLHNDVVGTTGIARDITVRKQIDETLNAYRLRLEDMVGERTADLERTIEDLNAEIEQKKRVEAALEKNSALLQGVFDGIQDGIVVLDNDQNIIMTNHAIQKFFPNENSNGFKVKKCFEVLRQGTIRCGNCAADRTRTEKTVPVDTIPFTLVDGGAGWLEVYTFPFYSAQGEIEGVIKYLRDITKRKHAEEYLKDNESRYRTLFDKAGEGILQATIHGDIIAVNESFARMHGYTIVEMQNLNVTDLDYRADAKVHAERMKRLLTGESLLFQVEHRHKAGHAITLHVSVSTMTLNGERILLGFHRDITEKMRLEERGRRSDHLAALGQISAGIAHEINNPNHIVMSNAELLQDVWQDADPVLSDHYAKQGDFPLGGLPFSQMRGKVAPMLSRIINSTVRINSIVSGMKQYTSHIRDGYAERVVINDVLRSCLEMLRDQIASSTDAFRVVLDEGVPLIQGNRHALEQVIVHLVSNALQALQDRTGRISITTRHDASNNAVILQVMDEGRGMTPDVLRQATSPFYTTRQDKGGRGLGLSISLANVKNHNGSLDIESIPGKGTVATVRIPVYQ